MTIVNEFAYDEGSNAAEMTNFVFNITENIVAKGENNGINQHFLPFPTIFQMLSL